MEAPTVNSLLTTGGLAVAVVLITQLIWSTVRPSPDTKDRFGPLVAVIVGIVLSLIAVFTVGLDPAGSAGTDIFNAILSGLFVGATGMGIHDSIDSVNPNIV